MTNRVLNFNGTAVSGVAAVINLAMQVQDCGFQITAEGANTLLIETQEYDGSYVSQTSISGESLLVNLANVENVRITASGGNVDYTLTIKQCRVSTPQANWEMVEPVT